MKPSTQLTRTSYGCYHSATSEVFVPETEEDIASVLATARDAGRRVVICGSSLSLDRHALGQDITLDMRKFSTMTVDTASQTVRAGAGATWGDVLQAVMSHQLFPYVVISTRYVTVGGSLSANSLSRLSCIYGREGRYVESFRLLTVDGQKLHCSREQHADLFYGVIGGFGYLGVILDVTHRLQPIQPNTRVETSVMKCPSMGNLEEDLRSDDPGDARYVILSLAKQGVRKMSFRTRYVETSKLRQIWLYKDVTWFRVFAETVAHVWMWLAHAIWTFGYYFHPREGRPYVDLLEPFTFFTDGNYHSRKWMLRLGLSFRMVEQTFILPVANGKTGLFVERLVSACQERGLKPMLFDVLHLPEDEPFLLSSSRGLDGLAVNIAFEGLQGKKLDSAIAMFRELSSLCREWGGRVHLVKNVFADPADLQAMYADVLQPWQALKLKYDPNGVLGSGFLEDIIFGQPFCITYRAATWSWEAGSWRISFLALWRPILAFTLDR